VKIAEVVQRLDAWVGEYNREARAEGGPSLKPCRIRLVGQMALIELSAPLELRATDDVDAIVDAEYVVRKHLALLLEAEGKDLDPVAHEAWMPEETLYTQVYVGTNVVLEVADLESVLISKGLKDPEKNLRLLAEYITHGPSQRFLDMAHKYKLDLEQFV
jgi:hypothetical protein